MPNVKNARQHMAECAAYAREAASIGDAVQLEPHARSRRQLITTAQGLLRQAFDEATLAEQAQALSPPPDDDDEPDDDHPDPSADSWADELQPTHRPPRR